MNRPSSTFLAPLLVLCAAASAAEPTSGPAAGAAIPALKVFDATGPHSGKDVDYPAERKAKPTVYVFIKDWNRPAARFLRSVDGGVADDAEGAMVVAVWLSAKTDDTKEYLPKAQMSLKLENTAMTVIAEDAVPAGWELDTDAAVTVVVASGGKAVKSFRYVSVNETVADEVRKTLKTAASK